MKITTNPYRMSIGRGGGPQEAGCRRQAAAGSRKQKAESGKQKAED
jgi:hypothetical protein